MVFLKVMEILSDIQVGERCRALRESSGKSPEDAATVLGTSVEDVRNLESGEERPAPHDLVLLGELYESPAIAFLSTEQTGFPLFRHGESSDEGVTRSRMQMQGSIKRFFAARAMEKVTR